MATNEVKIIVLTRFSVYNYAGKMTARYMPHVKTEEDFIKYLYSKERLDTKIKSLCKVVEENDINAQILLNHPLYIQKNNAQHII